MKRFELKSHEPEARTEDSRINGSGHPGELCEFGELFSGPGTTGAGCALTVLSNDKGYATKVFDLDDKGQLRKRSAANIYEGEAERVSISDLRELKELIDDPALELRALLWNRREAEGSASYPRGPAGRLLPRCHR